MATAVLRRSSRLAKLAARSELRPSLPKPVAVSVVSGRKRALVRRKEVANNNSEEDEIERSMHPNEPSSRPQRTFPTRDMEAELWRLGFQNVVGVDEAGRGPLAGPVVAAACIIPTSTVIEGIDDSKKLTESKREELFEIITTAPGVRYSIHVVDAATIDEVNILQATMQAMAASVKGLSCNILDSPGLDFILVDGNRLPDDFPTNARSVVKGDATSHVIAAASILAKVTRDRLMSSYDMRWPEYGFKSHKGYGTSAHVAALLKHGPCDIHRRSFAPLKDQLTRKTVKVDQANEEEAVAQSERPLRRSTRSSARSLL